MKYDDLDGAILARIDAGHTVFYTINSGSVAGEAIRLARLTERDSWRIVDSRLQSLRKRGVIAFVPAIGWAKRVAQ